MPSDIFLWQTVSKATSFAPSTLHDIRLVHGGDAPPAMGFGVVEGVARHPFRSVPGN